MKQIYTGTPALLFHDQFLSLNYEIENKAAYTLILLGQFFRYSFLSMVSQQDRRYTQILLTCFDYRRWSAQGGHSKE